MGRETGALRCYRDPGGVGRDQRVKQGDAFGGRIATDLQLGEAVHPGQLQPARAQPCLAAVERRRDPVLDHAGHVAVLVDGSAYTPRYLRPWGTSRLCTNDPPLGWM